MATNRSQMLLGFRVAYTGIESNVARTEVVANLIALGATYVEQVNARTDLLVEGSNPGNGKKKRDTASRYGIPIVLFRTLMTAASSVTTGAQLQKRLGLTGAPKQQRVVKQEAEAKAIRVLDCAYKDLANDQPGGFIGF